MCTFLTCFCGRPLGALQLRLCLRGSLRSAGMVLLLRLVFCALWHITAYWAVLCCPLLLLAPFHMPLRTNCCPNYCICAFMFAMLMFAGHPHFSLQGYWLSVLGVQILLWLGLSVYQQQNDRQRKKNSKITAEKAFYFFFKVKMTF